MNSSRLSAQSAQEFLDLLTGRAKPAEPCPHDGKTAWTHFMIHWIEGSKDRARELFDGLRKDLIGAGRADLAQAVADARMRVEQELIPALDGVLREVELLEPALAGFVKAQVEKTEQSEFAAQLAKDLQG